MALLFAIDGSNYLFRGHYAVPNLTSPKGQPVGAVKGFMEIVLADMRRMRPTHMAVAFDIGGKTWRHEVYPEYKGNRKPSTPEEKEVLEQVHAQRRIVRALLKAMGIRVIAKKGIEGDDILAGLALQHGDEHKVMIATKDKDIYQLVSSNVHIWPPDRKPVGPKGTIEKFGVPPEQIPEYLMLLGDKVDNIPGVVKCGPKTAAKWLTECGSIKGIIKQRPFKEGTALQKNFDAARKSFKITRQLVTARPDFLFEIPMSKLALKQPDMDEIRAICGKYGLKTTYGSIMQYFESAGKKKPEVYGRKSLF